MTPDQVNAIVNGIRRSVKERHEKTVSELPDFKLPALDILYHARDVAEGKVASIGVVNPRNSGFLNNLVQVLKRFTARTLNWFIREQVNFNHATLRYMDAQLEITADQNRSVLHLAQEIATLKNLYSGWRLDCEEKITSSEIKLLHSIREIESSGREREATFENQAIARHSDYLQTLQTLQEQYCQDSDATKEDYFQALDATKEDYRQALDVTKEDYRQALHSTSQEIQAQFWNDFSVLKTDLDRLIHTELRLIRQRTSVPVQSDSKPISKSVESLSMEDVNFDYGRFEERFRGDEQYVKQSQRFFLPYFRGCSNIVDLGCGRGEFLELARKEGIMGVGVDSNPEAVAICREKKINIEFMDIFTFLSKVSDDSIDGLFCSHVIEHIPARRLPDMISLVSQKLKKGGVVAIETPNPSCLAVFAGDFYLDPTHERPIPARLIHFYLEEVGFTSIELHERHPASEVFPELASLDESDSMRDFRSKFFGGLDYAVVARKV